MGRLLDEDDVIDAFAKLLAERCGGNRIWWEPVAEAVVNNLPSTQPEIVRCKDCRWFGDEGCAILIVDDSDKPKEDDFCSFAEKENR